MDDRIRPVTLEGRHVRLEPLSLDHLDGLSAVGLDPGIWRWMLAPVTTRDAMRSWIERALANQELGAEVPFATVERSSGQVVGSTRYLSIIREHRRLEIGWTWVAPQWHGSVVNPEAKLLMLEHAFERLGCQRVEFKTDALNERSRAALLGIGATFEGIFRRHMVMHDGRRRDSAYYSVVVDDWAAVRDHLRARIAARETVDTEALA